MKIREFTGSGGGGGGSSFREDANTLQVNQTYRALYAMCEGQIAGLANGSKSIYINDTPLQNADGTFNFGGNVAWDQRTGLPSQPYMKGFPSASAVYNVGTQVKASSGPLTKTTSAANIDQVRLTIGLPNGLFEQKTDQNAMVGATVQVQIDKKLSSSTAWVTDRVVTLSYKTTTAASVDVLLDRPGTTGAWDIRYTRLTPDSTAATLKNETTWVSYEEIQNVQLEYDNIAYVGVQVTAKDLGSTSLPVFSFEILGEYVRIPTNYDPVACTYTGVWDGSFKVGWTSNPAWHLFDLLTHPLYGMGKRLGDNYVDHWSFYAASQYNDGLVPDGNGGTERRFTCNVPLQSRTDALQVANDLASCMHAQIMWLGNRVVLIQDRPTVSDRLLVPADVINGLFDYSSTTLAERFTAANVTWNNPSDNYLQKVESISAGSESGTWATTLLNAQNTYGYNVDEIAAFGCTRQSQARRHGRWVLDSVLNLTDLVKFQMSPRGFDLQVGEVVTLHDPYYAGQQLGGLVAPGSTTTTIQLDRPITVTAGSTISVGTPTGVETHNITTAAGTVTSVTVDAAFTAAPAQYSTFIVTTAISPRQFKISKITQSSPGVIDVQGLQYDPNKWNRIENNLSLPAPVFSTFTALNPVSAPTTLSFQQQAQYVDNTVQRSLLMGWNPPASGKVASYVVLYRQALDAWTELDVRTNSVEIDGLVNGQVDVKVFAVNTLGVQSPALTGSYTINITGSAGSAATVISPVAGLAEANTGSTSAFVGQDATVKWTNPSSNAGASVSLKDFFVTVINPSNGATLRSEVVAACAPGSTQIYSYTFAKNNADTNNVPLRSVTFSVQARDANNNLTAATTATLTNPAPAAVTALSVTPGVKLNLLTWTNPPDVDRLGAYVWASKTSGFAPGPTNLVGQGDINSFTHFGLNGNETWYYRVAAYDTFSQSTSGTGLNLSSELAATTTSTGIPNGTSLPGSGVEGDLFYNKTDGKLYRFHSGAWTTAVPAVDMTGQVIASQIADGVLTTAKFASGIEPVTLVVNPLPTTRITNVIFNWSDGKMYRWNGSAYVATIPATDLTGQIVSTQITDGSISTPKLAAGAVTTANLTAGAVTANELAANSVVAGKIAAGAITANQIAAGAIVASKVLIADTNNVFRDQDFDDQASYSSPGGASFSFPLTTEGILGKRYVAIQPNAASMSVYSPTFTIESNADYLVSGYVFMNTADTASGSTLYMNLFSMDGSGNLNVTRTLLIGGTTAAYNGFNSRVTQNFTSAPNEHFADFVVVRNGGGTSAACSGGWRLQRRASSELIVDGSIITQKMAAGSVTTSVLAAGAVTSNTIAANTITAGNIAGSTITSSQIAAGTITAGNIAAGTITGGNIAASTIGADKLSVGSLSAISADVGLLRTATTGARTEISANKIVVYDASNVIRVKLGDLS